MNELNTCIMKKKLYTYPVTEVKLINTSMHLLAGSKPFEYGGSSPVDADPV